MTSIISRKPFYSSIATIVFFPLVVFVINGILVSLFGMETLEEKKIDNILHGFGGVSVCLSSAGVLWHLVRREIITLQDKYVFHFLVFGFLCFVVIGWEVLEYIVHIYIFPENRHLVGYSDTVIDMVLGLVGGLFSMFFVRRPVG